MSEVAFHRVLPIDGSRPPVGVLLTKGGGRIDDESAFLFQLGAILEGMTVVRLDWLIARARFAVNGLARADETILLRDTHEAASVQLGAETVAIQGHYVDRLTVATPRFIELLEGWRSVLAEDLMFDVDRAPQLFQEDDDGEDEPFGEALRATAVLQANGHTEVRYRLSDGSLTASRQDAMSDLPARRAQHAAATSRALDALAAHAPTFGRPTPARCRVVEALARDGLVPAAGARPFRCTGHISDGVWKLLRPLRDLASPQEIAVCRLSS